MVPMVDRLPAKSRLSVAAAALAPGPMYLGHACRGVGMLMFMPVHHPAPADSYIPVKKRHLLLVVRSSTNT
jgi:hypothetical protein